MSLNFPPSRIPSAFGPVIGLTEVVEALARTHRDVVRANPAGSCRYTLPSRDIVAHIVEDLRSVLFPGYFCNTQISDETLVYFLGSVLDRVARTLEEQICRGLAFACENAILDSENRGGSPCSSRDCESCRGEAANITRAFLATLPQLRSLLSLDVQAAYDGDPAARSHDETIFCYPGIRAMANHRIAHELNRLGVPLLPRMISELAHSETGIDIHPGASIGERFFIDHGTGVVIGETSIIGDGVRIYQGVTLGAKTFVADANGRLQKGQPRHPIVEDDVVIYAGATILGRVTIGRGSVIGGNLWVTRSVPPNSQLSQSPSRQEMFVQGGGI